MRVIELYSYVGRLQLPVLEKRVVYKSKLEAGRAFYDQLIKFAGKKMEVNKKNGLIQDVQFFGSDDQLVAELVLKDE